MSPHWRGTSHPFRSPRAAAAASGQKKRSRRLSSTDVTAELLEGRVLLSTYVVTNLNDAGPGSLRDAIARANQSGGADAVGFSHKLAGMIVLTSGQLEIGDDLTIRGPGASALTVSGSNQSRIFEVDANVTAAISGLTLAGGHPLGFGIGGGGVLNNGMLTLTDSTLANNFAGGPGGGIDNTGNGTLAVNRCTLSVNSAGGGGGGIENDGNLIVTGSTFSSNLAGTFDPTGGGITNYGVASVADSAFSRNQGGYGAGVANPAGTLAVARCWFANNVAANQGGGIYTLGMLSVSDSIFVGNSARHTGGGVDIENGTATLFNTLVALNSADQGGAIEIDNGTATLSYSIVFGNQSAVGSGIDSGNGTVTLYDTLVAGNSAALFT
ncbi:MAG TPA: hypothetical protein VGI81_13720 [Tepidisphaeraceae bacterium]